MYKKEKIQIHSIGIVGSLINIYVLSTLPKDGWGYFVIIVPLFIFLLYAWITTITAINTEIKRYELHKKHNIPDR